MITSGTAVINAPVEKIWEFVLDPNAYPKADTKITKWEIQERNENEMRSRTVGFLRWPFLRGAMVIRHRMKPYEHIEIESEPGSGSFPASLALEQFRAEFIFEKEGDTVKVTHVESYETKDNLFGRLAERLTGDWLKQHMQEEMQRLKELVES